MKISVITTTFNSGKTLCDTIESVLRQSYQNIEYIIVDGNSTDNTVAIIEKYFKKFNGRLRYISEPDKGIYDAMNKGMQMASGDIIGFLNSDDFYTSDIILEKVANSFHKNDIDAVYGDIHFVDNKNLKKCVRYYSSKIFKRNLMRFGFMPAHPSFYCKKELYQSYGGFDLTYKIGADFEMLLRLIYIHNIKLLYLPLDFVTMRTGGVSTAGFSSHRQIMCDHVKALKSNGIYSNMILLSLRYPYKIVELIKSRYF